MPHLSIVIKGPIKSAKRAAGRRGIPTKSCRVVNPKFGDVQCHAPCRKGVTGRVVRWYGERASTKPGRGHPPGTLLYFSGSCPTGLGRSRRRSRR